MPLISVIIPTWNRCDWLKMSIDSVLNQSFLDYDLIVVDDASSDQTQQILSEYSGNLKHIAFLENKGVSAARNAGIKNSDSKWLAFLDSDDFWHPQKLHKQVEHLKTKPEISIHFSDEIWIRNGVRVNPKKKHQKREGWIFQPSLELCLMSPSTVLLKRELLDQHGSFDENMPVCEDYDLWLRLTAHHQVALLNQKLMTRHGGHADQLSQSDWGFDRYRVQSIHKILQTMDLKPNDRKAAIQVLKQKCEILINGFHKREQFQQMDHYEMIKASY